MRIWLLVIGLIFSGVGLAEEDSSTTSLAQDLIEQIKKDPNQYPEFMADKLTGILEKEKGGEIKIVFEPTGRHWLFCYSFIASVREDGQTKVVIYERAFDNFWQSVERDGGRRDQENNLVVAKAMLAWGLTNEAVFIEEFPGHPNLYRESIPEDDLVEHYARVFAIIATKATQPLLAESHLTEEQTRRVGKFIKASSDVIESACRGRGYDDNLDECPDLRLQVRGILKASTRGCR